MQVIRPPAPPKAARGFVHKVLKRSHGRRPSGSVTVLIGDIEVFIKGATYKRLDKVMSTGAAGGGSSKSDTGPPRPGTHRWLRKSLEAFLTDLVESSEAQMKLWR